jgi:hypothetical protein
MAITLDGTTGITAPGVTDTGNLSVTGTSTLTGSIGNITAGTVTQTGSSTATSFIPTGSTVPANGMYLSAANTLNLATNTTNQVSISSAGIVTGTAGNLMLVQPTAQASTSGTSIDFTGIPSWVKRITVNFSGVSTNGTSVVQVQLGTSSGSTITGYVSGAFSYNTGAGSNSTTGLVVDQSVAATNTRYGSIVISTLGSNIWVSQGILQMTTTGSITPSTGGVTLGAVLDRVRITTVNGTDTFDAGTINIQYE